MRSKVEIQEILNNLDVCAPPKFPGMTYENGVDEALMWVLGDIDDDDFSVLGE